MYQIIFRIKLVLTVLLITVLHALAQQKTQLSYVNPFIGTTKSGVLTRWGGDGGTYPGAVAPSGFIQISPETRVSGTKGYNYTDSVIYYFSCMGHHSGFPEGAAGRLFVMPVTGEQFEPGQYKSHFSHHNEVALPGYYKVKFSDNNIIAEATTATRTGIFRFTFPAKAKAKVFVGDVGNITIISGSIIRGTVRNAVINFSEEFVEKKQVKGGYLFTFKSSNTAKMIELKLSTSSVSFAGSQNNINKETSKLSFDALIKRVSDQWSSQLAKVDITDNSEANKTIFYTALYHSLLIPWVISDADGNYRGEDGAVHQTNGKYEYGGFSPWDTFRSLHPLLSLLYPEKQKDAILSMLDIYKQTGHLPTETMTGNHAVPIIVDAYLKGITGFDKTLVYEAMKKDIVTGPFVQKDLEIYHQLGYVPYTNSESVTRTVEYAYDDWALSQYAKHVMNNETDYQLLQRRGNNYRNLFYPEAMFMLPRSGTDFKVNPAMSGYKEGDKWVYSYFVPHNAKDLVNLMGGDEAFVNRLDSALTNQVILFDNETVIHLPYLFNAAGRPDLTQYWCRNIMLSRYKNSPDGLPGNDDLGAMSSAYIFNALGIFPVSPGRAEYAIGSPLFQSVKLHLANKKTLVINSTNQSAQNKYVASLTVNNKLYEKLVVPHTLLMQGGTIQFVMSKEVQTKWPLDKDPVALSETKNAVDIRILKYDVQKNKVEPNEPLWLHFTLKNAGATGTKSIRLYANGSEAASKNILVPEGATLTDSVSCRLYGLGKVTVGLAKTDHKVTEVVEADQPVKHPFEISGITLKPLIKQGREQQLSYAIKNVTGKDQLFTVPVKLNDSLLYTDKVQVAPGESKKIEHHFIDYIPGVKNLIISDISSRYKVFNNDLSSLLLDLSLTVIDDKSITDSSGFGNNAYMISSKNEKLIAGKRMLFGEDNYLEVPNAPSLDNMGETITMMAWIYPEAKETGLIDMFTKGDTHVLQTNNNKTLTFFAGGWGRGDCTVNLPSDWKQHWHHIVGVCNGNLLSVYIDGKLIGTSTVEGSINLSVANKWQIGRNEEFPSERIFHGYMDKVKVYAQPLSGQEILDIFTKEHSGFINHPEN